MLCGAGALALALLAVAPLPAGSWLSAGPPDDKAAAPPEFGQCYDCHTTLGQPINSGDGALAILGVPPAYQPGATYALQVVLQDPGQSRWGFELTETDAAGATRGAFVLQDPAATQLSVSGARTFVKHRSAGTRRGVPDGPVAWNVDWTAPAAGAGTLTFWAAGNAANNRGNVSGDAIYSTAAASAEAGSGTAISLRLQPDTSRPIRGRDWTIRAHVREHTGSGAAVWLASRVRLPDGRPWPRFRSLLPPVPLQLAPLGSATATLVHALPLSVPPFAGRYEAFLGTPGRSVVASDSFDFTLR
ncbi:MAG TPA: choice-of-anchor V domain-containing protein [Planctomycetota bacterium]